ncbi:MAG: O-antigen ligase family protein [Chloracidobacterium sp.]|nr:O-antigen ligase family protein [Chloracidobacterium sp.]
MAFKTIKSKEYRSLTNPARKSKPSGDIPSLMPPQALRPENDVSQEYVAIAPEFEGDAASAAPPLDRAEPRQPSPVSSGSVRHDKKARNSEKDQQLLTSEKWLVRAGHKLTYIGLFLFSIMVLFRPYEIVPGLGFLSATAFYFALATILLFVPSQLAAEGTLTTFPTEVKAILAMALIALLTMPLAKDPAMAWETFNDPFIKAVIIFVVLVNVVRTRLRLLGMMWLSFGIGIYLGISALNLYSQGKFAVEEYRIAVDVGGMFGNPNEMALHFVMMTPIVFSLGLATPKKLVRISYFAMASLFVAANMVTFSRGGFLGLIACLAVLAWKLGRKYRLNVAIGSIIIGGIAIVAAPGNYGLRMLSIFIPGLDAAGSSDQRWELLMRSLLVSARNPWGIGIGNFPIVGIRSLQSHNAFTQVSAELGILGLIAYLVFIISPYRKLSAIERTLFDADDHSWYYYLAIGLQASIVGYLVSSFFASVAYNWFVYYLIAYAVAFRRIYTIETGGVKQETAAARAAKPVAAV